MTHPFEQALAQNDFKAIDSAIARAFKKLDAFRRDLRRGEKDLADPIAAERLIAGKIAFDRVTAMLPSDELARVGARRHIAELCLFRLSRELEEDFFEATHAEHDLYARAKGTTTFATSAFAILAEKDTRERRAHLDALASASLDVAAAARERDAIRVEGSSRLGLEHPLAWAAEVPLASLEESARVLLTKTEWLFFDVIARRAKKNERAWSVFDAFDLALAVDANDGWPARLQLGWFGEAVPAMAKFGPNQKRKTTIVGASTFLRELAIAGEGLRASASPKSLPFVVAHDPFPRAAYRLGQTFAALGTHTEFHRRVLGLSPGPARDQAAKIAESALIGARIFALRVLVAVKPSMPASEFEALSRRALGAPLDPKLRGAWPRPSLAITTRFVAMFEAHSTFTQLVERYDEDWFRNPMAAREIMSRASGPIRDVAPPEDLVARATAFALAFEEALK